MKDVFSENETQIKASEISEIVKNGSLMLLFGDLGSGKTTFIKYLALSLGFKEYEIKSPTFTYIRKATMEDKNFYHIDLYRINGADEMLMREIEEIIENPKNIVAIEWADKLSNISLPKKHIKISFQYISPELRKIEIENNS